MSFRLFLFGNVSGPRDPKRTDHTSSLIVTLSFLKHIGYSSQCPNHLWLSSASTNFLILREEIGTSLFFQFFVFYSWISRVSNVYELIRVQTIDSGRQRELLHTRWRGPA